MCGRYYIAIDEDELRDICDSVERKQRDEPEQMEIKLSGEVFPTDIVPVQAGSGYTVMKWGFSGFDGRPVINARSETALIKPMFRESMRMRRCLIPASGYYEWKREGNRKIKHQIYIPEQPIYLAGCFRKEGDAPLSSFVVLTREAEGGLESIHDRMPLIIPKSHAKEWLLGDAEILNKVVTAPLPSLCFQPYFSK